MTEIKPGKWRLKDGREVVVLARSRGAVLVWCEAEELTCWWTVDSLDDAECLGPAVIGDPGPDVVGAWVQRCNALESQCKELEAETVATRELLEKAEERCEELAKELEQPAKSQWAYVPVIPRAQQAETKLASAQCVIEGLEERIRFLEEQAAGMPEVSDENGVKVYRYKSVTVMVRGEREGLCYRGLGNNELWYVFGEMNFNNRPPPRTREDAEAWCREQLEPKWREATEGDVGKACRCKDGEENEWSAWQRLVAVIDHEWKYIAADDMDHEPTLFRFCEVQD